MHKLSSEAVHVDVIRNTPYILVALSNDTVSIMDFRLNKTVYSHKKPLIAGIK